MSVMENSIMKQVTLSNVVVPENIHTSPMEGFLFEPPTPTLQRFQFYVIQCAAL